MPEEEFQSSSFIPKSGTGYEGAISRRKQFGLLLTVSIVLFVLAALAAGGAFFYTQYLQEDLAEKQQQLQAAQSDFGPEAITQLSEISTKISTANQLLEQHTAVTPVFDLIESVTLSSVQLTAASISKGGNGGSAGGEGGATTAGTAGDSGGVSLTLDGVARDYAAVVLQVEALENDEEVSNASLDSFDMNSEGRVDFTVSFSIPEEYMSYSKSLE